MGKYIHPWIGVDLDGTLAKDISGEVYDPLVIGQPVPTMVERVLAVLEQGEYDVRIFTARVFEGGPIRKKVIARIKAWCRVHLGRELEITCKKDYGLREIWDDRAYKVERNTGRMPEKERGW